VKSTTQRKRTLSRRLLFYKPPYKPSPYFQHCTPISSPKVIFTASNDYTDYPKEPAQDHPPGMSGLAQRPPDRDPQVSDFLPTAFSPLRITINDCNVEHTMIYTTAWIPIRIRGGYTSSFFKSNHAIPMIEQIWQAKPLSTD
jgi:hypothetical protein